MENTTKTKILNAARTLFIAHGFAGTSIGKIAKLAQVNHSLIFHHFTNKENLWIEVKHQVAEAAQKDLLILPTTAQPFRRFLEQSITNSLQYYRNNPDLIRLLNWQRLESNDNLQIGITHSQKMQAWIKAITHYQTTGEINATLRPEFMVSYYLAVVSSAALDPNIFIQKETDQRAYIDFCIECFMKGFK